MASGKFFDAWRVGWNVLRHGVDLGAEAEAESGCQLYLPLKRLETHVDIMGAPGSGKTRLHLSFFNQLSYVPNATLIYMNPKGAGGRMARDLAIANGQADRLIVFDPSNPEVVLGYNPLKPNTLPVATHAKAVREAIRSAWGQGSFDVTPQLARFLYLGLAAARELNLNLDHAVMLLRPASKFRKEVLSLLHDPFLKQTLEYFDRLPASRQEELAASTLARLESFVFDPAVRRILTASPSLDLGNVMVGHKILIFETQLYRPLRLDDVKLLGRLFINDLVAHAFAMPVEERGPVYLMMDEAHLWATHDLCTVLDLGRELGLHCIFSHQHPGQFRDEDESGYIFGSILNCVRTKIIGGGLSVRDLEPLTAEVMLSEYDPWEVKDELYTYLFEPVESSREVISEGWNRAHSRGRSRGSSQSVSRGDVRGHSRERGLSENESTGFSTSQGRGVATAIENSRGRTSSSATTLSHGRTRGTGSTETSGRTDSSGTASSSGTADSTGHSHGSHSAIGLAEFTLPESDEVVRRVEQHSDGTSDGDFRSHTDIATESHQESVALHRGRALHRNTSRERTYATQRSRAMNEGESFHYGQNRDFTEAEQYTRGTQRSCSEGIQETVSHTKSFGRDESVSDTLTEGISRTRSRVPWNEYHKRRIVSSRTFLPREEFLTLCLQRIREQPLGHFVVKTVEHAAIFFRSRLMEVPDIGKKLLSEGLRRIFGQPFYSRVQDLDEKHRDHHQLLGERVPALVASTQPTFDPDEVWRFQLDREKDDP